MANVASFAKKNSTFKRVGDFSGVSYRGQNSLDIPSLECTSAQNLEAYSCNNVNDADQLSWRV